MRSREAFSFEKYRAIRSLSCTSWHRLRNPAMLRLWHAHLAGAEGRRRSQVILFGRRLRSKDRIDQVVGPTICMDCFSSRFIRKTTSIESYALKTTRNRAKFGEMMDHIYPTRSSRGRSPRLKYPDSRGT